VSSWEVLSGLGTRRLGVMPGIILAMALCASAAWGQERDAFRNNWIVTLDYNIDPGKKNGIIVRTWITKPPTTPVFHP
jgi:hypothetical protein